MTRQEASISRSNDALRILREVGKALTSTLDLDRVLRALMDMVARFYEPGDWSLLLVDEESGELYFQIVVGDAAERVRDVRIKIGEGIAGWVAEHGKPLITLDAYHDERFARWVDQKSGFKTESIVCVPLVSKGRTLGVIELLNVSKSNQEKEHLELLEALADFAAIAIENARFVNKVKKLSIIDDTSGLYNARHMHALLDNEISRAMRYNYPFSIIFLDLDHFKLVNDSHGHLIGSQLLKEIGQVIKYEIRTVDWPVRYGGDEFVIILPRADRQGALNAANRLRDALNETVFFQKEGLNIKVTASFGLATYPDDALNKEDIIRMADQAMYRVKDTTRDGICAAADGLKSLERKLSGPPENLK